MLPIVGKFTNNIFYNGGHGHLGWTLAPATAQHLVEIL
jgi:glycine/D-amino acid oxidase-like deaminating enzyme